MGEFRQTVFEPLRDVFGLKVGQTVIYTNPSGSTNMYASKDAREAGLIPGKPYKISEVFGSEGGPQEIRVDVPGRSDKHTPLNVGMFEKPRNIVERLFGRNMNAL